MVGFDPSSVSGMRSAASFVTKELKSFLQIGGPLTYRQAMKNSTVVNINPRDLTMVEKKETAFVGSLMTKMLSPFCFNREKAIETIKDRNVKALPAPEDMSKSQLKALINRYKKEDLIGQITGMKVQEKVNGKLVDGPQLTDTHLKGLQKLSLSELKDVHRMLSRQDEYTKYRVAQVSAMISEKL